LNRNDSYSYELSKIQDGGQQPFLKPINRRNSATICAINAKFGHKTHIGYLYCKNCNGRNSPVQFLRGPVCVIMSDFVAIGRTLQWLTAAILKTEKPSYLSSGLAD